MKQYSVLLLGAALLTGAASCSQQIDEPTTAGGGLTTVSVNIPVNDATSRAVPEIPEGYTLRCIMQLVGNDDAAIADARYVETVAPGSENVSFSFVAPADGYKGAMFWADYVKDVEADFIYTTTDLTAITYNSTNSAEVFNNAAADAFYGYMLSGNKSIALKRPFTRITFKNIDQQYAAYTSVKVTELPAPTNFNVKNGETSGNATIASNELSITDGVWFSTYLFVGTNAGATLGEGNDIKITLGGTTSTDITINGADVPMTENYDITAIVSPTAGDLSNVTVTFPEGMYDPNAPRDIALGDFVNADGTYTTTFDADKAVAIVYALAPAGTKEGDKEVAAYAFGITQAGRAPVDKNDPYAFAGTEPLSNASYTVPAGPQAWAVFENLAGASNNSVKYVTSYIAAHPLTGANLSQWYVGSASQLVTLVGHMFNGEGWTLANKSNLAVEFPTRIDAVANAFETAKAALSTSEAAVNFTHDGNVANFLSATIGVVVSDAGNEGTIASVQVNESDKSFGALTCKLSGSCCVRPIISIYK